jgi:hypothetical protein
VIGQDVNTCPCHLMVGQDTSSLVAAKADMSIIELAKTS